MRTSLSVNQENRQTGFMLVLSLLLKMPKLSSPDRCLHTLSYGIQSAHAFLGPLGTLARMMEATLKFVVCDFELEFQFKPKNTI